MHTRLLLILPLLLLALLPLQADETDPLHSLPDCGFAAQGTHISGLEVGVVLLDLESGAGCVENLDMVFPVASVPKLFIAGAYLEWVAQGQASLDTQVVFSERYYMAGRNDCLTESEIGNSYRLSELNELMISCSDNAATWMLYDAIGGGRVQQYIDGLGIAGIGPVIPYSEVDRLKLTFLDERWAEVPRAMASRFYRARRTAGLVPQYFEFIPAYSGGQIRRANEQYFATYDYNTATPRAIAEYLLLLREHLLSGTEVQARTARLLLNAMLLTQRLHTAQALPGTVYLGAKNGNDTGLTAEVSFGLRSLENLLPDSLVIVFTRQTDGLTGSGVQRPGDRNGPLDRYLRALSPQISALLFPQGPERIEESELTLAFYNHFDDMGGCWWPYRVANFSASQVPTLEACWRNLLPARLQAGQRAGLGLVLRGVPNSSLRMTIIFSAPDGTRYSYQTARFFQPDAAFYWYHPLDQAGVWIITVYRNLAPIWQQAMPVG